VRFFAAGFSVLALFDTLTQVSFKLATQRTGAFAFATEWLRAAMLSPWTYVAIAGYLGAFVTWMTLLEHAPVGPAFAASHIDIVTVLLISVPLFGERLTLSQLAGAACIVAGILLLSRSQAAGGGSQVTSVATACDLRPATRDLACRQAADSPPDVAPALLGATPPESPAADRVRSAGA
jgi:drug/metabolite transporter (DMT)-like permease